MEGGIDMEDTVVAPPATSEQSQEPGHVPEEGNKFQKAIGAWRSMDCSLQNQSVHIG